MSVDCKDFARTLRLTRKWDKALRHSGIILIINMIVKMNLLVLLSRTIRFF